MNLPVSLKPTNRPLDILRITLGILILLLLLTLRPLEKTEGASVSRAADWWPAVQADVHRREYHVTWEGSSLFPGGLVITPTWSATSNQDGAVLGYSVSTAGDVNGDGYADLIVGAPRYDHGQTEEGVAFLYLGGPDGPAASPAWMEESDQEWAWFGYAVAIAGDVNGDGYDDVIIGAPRYDITGTTPLTDTGRAFVYYGSPTVSEATLTAGPADWIATGNQADARFGTAVSTAGDVNGDGYADVIITANGYDGEETNEGAAFVYLGSPAGLAADYAWAVHPTDQAYANFGRSASTAGDVNGDGYSDVVIGAPWYDDPLTTITDEIYEGVVFVYHGSVTGLSLTSDWTFIGDHKQAEFGTAVSAAGDVDGDGYSDVIVGAYRFSYTGNESREGEAFVFHGAAAGLGTSHDWRATGDQEQAKFGIAVSTAGDVNGDGYADVIVGASNYDGGQPHEGAVFVYDGGSGGLTTGHDWSVEGNQEGAGYGFAVSTAGDVNGDGDGDVIVGAPTYNDGQTDEGAAFVYLGSSGDDLAARPRQLRTDGHTPIAPLGLSDSANQVHLQLTAQPPQGIISATLQWQVAPLGVPFTAATAISGTSPGWSDVLTTGVVLSQTVDGLTGGTVYRWRMRLLYWPSGQSRWLYLPWNGPQEADFRTPSLLAPDRDAKALPGYSAVYTHTLTNPTSETQSFTLTAASSQGYTVTVATALGGLTVALPAFGCSPVTVTVQTPATAITGTQDTTIVTATSGLSGHDAVYDVTTVDLATADDPNKVFLPLILRSLPLSSR